MIENGWLKSAQRIISPNRDDRPPNTEIDLLVIHNISLPPGEFSGEWISALFTNSLPIDVHPYFATLEGVRVSAHLLIRRTGEIIQYVPFHLRAWHAGLSSWQGRPQCNDYSLGIELEGTDFIPYSEEQYSALILITRIILDHFPRITLNRIVGHSDIAPGRKTDPGPAFDWQRFRAALL